MTLIGATITVAVLSILTALLVLGLMAAEAGAATPVDERYGLIDARGGRAGVDGKNRHSVGCRGSGAMARVALGQEERTP